MAVAAAARPVSAAVRRLFVVAPIVATSLVACSVEPSVEVTNSTGSLIVVRRMPDNLDRARKVDLLITVKPGHRQFIKLRHMRNLDLTITVGSCTYFYPFDDRFDELSRYYNSYPVPVEVMPDHTLVPLKNDVGVPGRAELAKLGFPRAPSASRCVSGVRTR